METKLKKSTYISLLFFLLVIVTYSLRYFIDDNYYRKLLSNTTLFIFYPSLLLSILPRCRTNPFVWFMMLIWERERFVRQRRLDSLQVRANTSIY
jgi:hypothetical protein